MSAARVPRLLTTWWGVLAPLMVDVCALRVTRSIAGTQDSQESVSEQLRAACALSLVRSQLADSSHVAVLGQAHWLGDFLRAARVPATLLRLGEAPEFRNLESDVVFLVTHGVGSRSFVKTALTQLRDWNASYERVVLWWDFGNAQAAVEAARDLHVVRLLVVSGTSEPLHMYGYREKCINGKLVSMAVEVALCGAAGLQPTAGPVFLDLARWNLWGCPLHLSVGVLEPFRFITRRPEGGYTLQGTQKDLAYAFANRLNATLNVPWTEYEWRQQKMKEPDLIYTVFVVDTLSRQHGPSYFTSCVALVVPAGAGSKSGPFELLHREFSPGVWAMVGLSYVVFLVMFAFIWRGVRQHPVRTAAFFVLARLFGNSVGFPMTSTFMRVLAVCWLVLCMVLHTAYMAALHSLQAAPDRPPEINSLPQLARAKLLIQGFPFVIEHFKSLSEGPEGNSTLLQLSAVSWNMGSTFEALKKVVVDRNSAFLHPWQFMGPLLMKREQEAGRKLVHKIPDFCSRKLPLYYFFVYNERSRLLPALSAVVTNALDAGLLSHMYRQREYHQPAEARLGWGALGLSGRGGLGAVFKLFGVGLAVSALAFTVEFLEG